MSFTDRIKWLQSEIQAQKMIRPRSSLSLGTKATDVSLNVELKGYTSGPYKTFQLGDIEIAVTDSPVTSDTMLMAGYRSGAYDGRVYYSTIFDSALLTQLPTSEEVEPGYWCFLPIFMDCSDADAAYLDGDPNKSMLAQTPITIASTDSFNYRKIVWY